MVQLMGDTISKKNTMVSNFYQAKRLMQKLGLGYLKIDCCPNGCMLYYKENLDKSITNCSFSVKVISTWQLIGEGLKKSFMLKKCGTLHSFQD